MFGSNANNTSEAFIQRGLHTSSSEKTTSMILLKDDATAARVIRLMPYESTKETGFTYRPLTFNTFPRAPTVVEIEQLGKRARFYNGNCELFYLAAPPSGKRIALRSI